MINKRRKKTMKKAIVVKVIEADEGSETKWTDYTLSMDEMTDSLIKQIGEDAGVDLGLHDIDDMKPEDINRVFFKPFHKK